jgi:hypothetical protein
VVAEEAGPLFLAATQAVSWFSDQCCMFVCDDV